MTKLQELEKQTPPNVAGETDKVQLAFLDGRAIAIVTLNDPVLGNPMSPEMGDVFTEVVAQLKQLEGLRAVIVRGAGEHFSVGGHKDMLTKLADPKLSAEARHNFMLGFYDRWLSLLDIPVPVIAAIEGDCIGVAPIFACVSDICVADESANFQITFAGLGLYPGMAISYLVPKIVGAQQAALMMVAGAPFSGKQAAECGFVAKSVPKGTVHSEALKIARQIAANVDKVTRPLTQAIRVKRSDLQPTLESDATRQAESYSTQEFRERIARYLLGWYESHKAAKVLVGALAFVCFLLSHHAGASDSGSEQEIRSIYKNLIDAENRHDLPAVRELVWNSPSTLFVAKAPVGWHGYWGIDGVIQHLHDMYQQPFRIDPIYEEEKVVLLTSEFAETYAPVRISVAYGGQNPAPKPFVMVLLWIHTPAGWKMTTDIPIPVPPDPAPH